MNDGRREPYTDEERRQSDYEDWLASNRPVCEECHYGIQAEYAYHLDEYFGGGWMCQDCMDDVHEYVMDYDPFPTCVLCGATIEENAYKIDGEYICEGCKKECWERTDYE